MSPRCHSLLAVSGRLIRANGIEFNWYRLSAWINITEQWPYRTSWLLLYYEEMEGKLDDGLSLLSIYETLVMDMYTSIYTSIIHLHVYVHTSVYHISRDWYQCIYSIHRHWCIHISICLYTSCSRWSVIVTERPGLLCTVMFMRCKLSHCNSAKTKM